MNKKIKAKWVKALRSGRYGQGNAYLKSDRHYCCLGVLCNVMGAAWRKSGVEWKTGLVPFIKGVSVGRRRSETGLLGRAILSKAGMTDRTQKHLAKLNDNGSSFKEIADYIEKNL